MKKQLSELCGNFDLLFGVSGCGPGWVAGPDSCYRFFSGQGDRDDAENRCVELGGHLVHIETEKENHFLSNTLHLSLPGDFNIPGQEGTDAGHCQLHVVFRGFRIKTIYKNIIEISFLFLHERWPVLFSPCILFIFFDRMQMFIRPPSEFCLF